MNRKPRKDSKLHRLPADQRARVDKWLFDKGLTYQQVADGCRKLFGLKISKSSVGRYYQGESMRRINTGLQPGEERSKEYGAASAAFTQNSKPLKRLHQQAGSGTGLKPGVNADHSNFELPQTATPEERWQELLARLTDRAMELTIYLSLEPDDETAREVAQIMRLLISARRERTDGMLAQLYRKKFEMWAAKEVYRYYLKTHKREKRNALAAGRCLNPQAGTPTLHRRASNAGAAIEGSVAVSAAGSRGVLAPQNSRKAQLQNERFREEIQQMVEHAMASEKLRQECSRRRKSADHSVWDEPLVRRPWSADTNPINPLSPTAT